MNSSVPLSPPLMSAALTRIEITSTTIAQNSVVLKLAFVSWLRSAMRARTPVVRGVSTRGLPVAPVLAIGVTLFGWVLASEATERALSALAHRRFMQDGGRLVALAPLPA